MPDSAREISNKSPLVANDDIADAIWEELSPNREASKESREQEALDDATYKEILEKRFLASRPGWLPAKQDK